MQEISIKRPTRGTPAAVTPPRPSGLILPEEPQETPNTPAMPEAGEDDDSDPAGSSAASTTESTGANTKKVFIRTFGCQMNEYDSDKMVDVLRQSEGAELVSTPEEADIILFNTYSVREKTQEI